MFSEVTKNRQENVTDHRKQFCNIKDTFKGVFGILVYWHILKCVKCDEMLNPVEIPSP